MPVADLCRKAGISPATYFNWKKKYDGLLPTEMRRLEAASRTRTRSCGRWSPISAWTRKWQDAIRRKLWRPGRKRKLVDEARGEERFDPPGLPGLRSRC